MNTDTQSCKPALSAFGALALNKPILKALTKSGYSTPTPIQEQAIPKALTGQDLLLSAQTGSGKTAAFVLPILDKLSRKERLDKHIHALILTPTRELAQQVQDSVRRYGANIRGLYSIALVGGTPYGGQIRALRKGVQIVIATPGRLIDHMNDGRVDLSALDVLVLDEADRMLDMGFADDIKTILQAAPATRQTVMSSATWDGAVGNIAESFTNNPHKVAIEIKTAHINESVYYCDDFHHKNKILLELLGDPNINQAVIFTATKRSTEQLTDTLTAAGLSARYLHGDLPQGKRNRIISDVKTGKCSFLIATDVAARGIDISAISHVVNYDLPRQVEDYVHRIGRCGRAGRTGVAMNLCSMDDCSQLRNISRYLKRDIKEMVLEGLEPKRNFSNSGRDETSKNKKTKRGRFNKHERFGRENTTSKKQDEQITTRQPTGYAKKPKLAHYDALSIKGKTKKAFYDKIIGDKTGKKRQDRLYDSQGFEGKKRLTEQDGMLGLDETKTPRGRFDGRSKLAKQRAYQNGSLDKRGNFKITPKKAKPTEEVFFVKRTAKKAKRKFGEL